VADGGGGAGGDADGATLVFKKGSRGGRASKKQKKKKEEEVDLMQYLVLENVKDKAERERNRLEELRHRRKVRERKGRRIG